MMQMLTTITTGYAYSIRTPAYWKVHAIPSGNQGQWEKYRRYYR